MVCVFFQVYLYQYKHNDIQPCCLNKQRITEVFPAKTSNDLTSPDGNSYAADVDSVYYSYYHRTLFFIKGEDVWKDTNYRMTGTPAEHSMVYVGNWFDIWRFICDVNCDR